MVPTSRLSEQEQAWVSEIRAERRTALETLFRAYYADLCEFALAYVKTPAIAEELVQDVFLRIWQSRANWEPRGTVRGYLFKATRNRALNYIKHTRIEDRADSLIGQPPDEAVSSVESEVECAELESAVRTAVESLPDRCRRIFSMSRENGLTYSQIARTLGISIKTVETQMGRALKALRRDLASFL